MSKKYRVTPKNGKWIIQDIETRKTVSAKPFIKKSDAEDAANIACESCSGGGRGRPQKGRWGPKRFTK